MRPLSLYALVYNSHLYKHKWPSKIKEKEKVNRNTL